MDEKGKRSPAHNRGFCTANADAVTFVIANLVAYLQTRPEIQIFDFWPPDGIRWCQCGPCKALGTTSDQQAILLGKAQAEVAKVRPDVRLEVIAYSSYVDPPQTAKLDTGVLVDFCPIGQNFDVQIDDPAGNKNAEYVAALTAWRKKFSGDISIYSYYRKYAWDSRPVIIPHYMQKDLRWYLTLPIQGISTYAEPGDWAAYESNHYILARLAWNPAADVDALVKKFAEARFGPAAEAAVAACGALEETVRVYGGIPGTALKDAAGIAKAGERVKAAAARVEEEGRRAPGPGPKRALERLGLSLAYAAADLDLRRMQAAKAKPEEIRKRVDTFYALVETHQKDGVFLVHLGRMSKEKLLGDYGINPNK